MVEMNLLAWRASLHRFQIKQMQKIGLITCFFGLASVLLPYLFLKQDEIRQQSKLNSLEAQVEQMQFLQSQRPIEINQGLPAFYYQFKMNQFFHLFAKSYQDLCFTAISRSEKGISFQGKSHSNQALTQFLLTWEGSAFFSEIKIEQIISSTIKPFVQFHFQAMEKSGEIK